MKINNILLYLLIFVFFFSCFAVISSGRYGGDGLENYLTAKSMILDKDLSIGNNLPLIKEVKDESRGAVGRGGLRYSSYGIGMPILLIPLYLLGCVVSKIIPNIQHDYVTQFCVSLTNPVLIALTIVVLFYLLSKMGFSSRTSLLSVICYGFSTMSLVYVRSGFCEPAIGLLLILSVLFLYRYEETSLAGFMVIVGFLAGYALLIKSNSFLYFPLLGLYLLYKSFGPKPRAEKVKLWLALCIPLAVLTAVYFYFNSIMHCGDSASSADMCRQIIKRGMPEHFQILKGLMYYLFSAGKGYFFYNLPLFIGLFGIAGLIKKRKELSLFFLAIVLFNLLFYSFRFNRGSIFSWGPRYLYPTVPIMCIFLAEFIENSKSSVKKIIVWVSLAVGFLLQAPCLFINFSKYIFFIKEQVGLQEYMINFIPELSPIVGCWRLFISAIHRAVTGLSLNFVYNPDPLFVEPVTRSMNGYDGWDIWWVNIADISPGFYSASLLAALFLTVLAVASFMKIRQMVKK